MLITLILVALVMLVVFAGMAIGVLFGRNPIQGSCGGIGSQAECPCGKKPATCGVRKETGQA